MKKGLKRFNNIFFRVYGSFAILILVFAVLLGVIFVRLYTTSIQTLNERQLYKISDDAAGRIRNSILNEDYESLMQFLEMYNGFESAELWLVPASNDTSFEASLLMGLDMSDIEKHEGFGDVIDEARKGLKNSDVFYSDIHGATTMAVATPVLDAQNRMLCVLVLIEPLEEMDETIASTKNMVFISALAALMISFLLALAFARRVTEPVRQMKLMTRDMMEGNYKCKTGIDRTDEIGEMARSIDMLSDKLLENEVERKNMEQMRLDFFANVSHELRTPITVVRAYTESLIDGVVSSDEKKNEYYERILGECKNMQRLVGDLLTLSKMQNPNFKIEKEPVELMEIFDEIVTSASAIAEDKNITIEFNHDEDTYMMLGDYDRLRQMFLVIFDNAVKFSPTGSTIHLSVSAQDKITVSIRDEGIGISREELPSIFDKFYKSKLRQNAKGTGLGLPIAKYICLKHDGEINVESEEGKGTCFTFTFSPMSSTL